MSTPTSALFLLTQHIPEGGRGGLFTKTGRRCERGKMLTSSVFLEFRLAGGGAGVRVAKFLEFRLEGGGAGENSLR